MKDHTDPAVIVGAARTPIGAFQGELSAMTAPQLGGVAIKSAVERAGPVGDLVEEALIGCVLSAGLGQSPARQAVLVGGLGTSVACTTVSKVCGSGMKAVMLAHDLILSGSADIAIAGGMESMSNAPYLLQKGRGGYRIGHAQVFDHMMLDGLEDAYDIDPNGSRRSMGTFGEDCAEKYGFSREEQDDYAIESVLRAQRAAASGAFGWEIAPIALVGKEGTTVIGSDEGPRKIKVDKIPTLKPSFRKNGSITAASSSSINDGAAALVLMRESKANALGLTPLARIVGFTAHAHDPAWFTTAPIFAIEKLYEKIGWSTRSVDLFEINEAFAVVAMAAMADLEIPSEKINVHGGACALGHPIGASGARILVTLLGALRATGGTTGVASLCIGDGEATAMGLERMS